MNNMKEVLCKYGVVLEEKVLKDLEGILTVPVDNLSKKGSSTREKKEKVEMLLLPYSGVIEDGCCRGMKANYGLHSQCQTEVKEGVELCVAGKKQSEKNESKEPDGGRIETRLKEGEEYKDKNGKKPVAYVSVMRKQGLTSEKVLEYVKAKGFTLDVRHLDEKEKTKKEEKAENY